MLSKEVRFPTQHSALLKGIGHDRTVSGMAQPLSAIATVPTTLLNKETPTKLATSL
ncbi:MAG: hypothetical protein V7K26_10575 [Nostoc sp.]|uniref:hypothetical protein n=1 Tax=Nostoc sp. TaxID=1180 RepID=UPI002FEF3EE1